MPYTDLPGCNKRSAPSFNGRTDELGHYFSELEDLYAQHQVITDANKKQGVIKYLATMALERTWKVCITVTDVTKTYNEMKEEMHKLYLGSSEEVFTINHIDTLIGKQTWIGIHNTMDLGKFYREFKMISQYLIDRNRMSQAEQTRGFFRAVGNDLKDKIKNRLQIVWPQHKPQDPYELSDLYDAACYAIHNSNDASIPKSVTNDSPVHIKAKLQQEVQSAIRSAMSEMTEMFKTVFAAQAQFAGRQANHAQARAPAMAQPQNDANPRDKCNFCGGIGHFMRKCKIMSEYMWLVKCKHNVKNKIVLPSGLVVPRDITGTWLHDRIDEYHCLNPNQQGTVQMLCEISAPATTSTFVHIEEELDADVPKKVCFEPEVGQPGVYALKKQSSSKGKAKEPQEPRIIEIQSDNANEAEATRFLREIPPHIPAEPDLNSNGTSSIEHPFAHPSQQRLGNVAVEAAVVAFPSRQGSYTTNACIYDKKVADKVFDQILNLPVMISQRELLSLAPEIHVREAEAMTKQHIVRTNTQPVLPRLPDTTVVAKATRSMEAHMPTTFAKAVHKIPEDATIIQDPYEVFLRSQPSDADGKEPIKVATESNVLCAIMPLVAEQEYIEAILDPWCQIIAMSEEVCLALAIPYNPNVCLNMVSANGGVNQLLGLAKNVPFKIGEITVYLQVHILWQPTYNILLGQPFFFFFLKNLYSGYNSVRNAGRAIWTDTFRVM